MFTDFLNNLWIAFSSPNEVLINIILFLAGFVENFLLMQFFLAVTNTNASKLKMFIYVLVTSIVFTISRHFIPDPFNIIINYVILFLLAKYLFNPPIFKTIIGIICFYVIFALIGILILNPFLQIFKITYEITETIPLYRILYLIIFYLMVYLIIFFMKLKNLKLYFIDNLDKKNKIILIINFITGILAVYLQIVIIFYYISDLPIIFTILSFISLLAYFVINIYTFFKANELFKTTEALHNAEEYNKTLQIIHDSVRGFKHDFDNIVMTIGGYIHTNDMEGLKNYYSNLQEDCQMANNLYMLNPNIVNDPGIYNLLTNKYYKAEEKNIKLNFSFLLDFSKLNMNIYEFTRILGILTDNAIEAANECEEKIINISFRNEEKNNRQIVFIENTYKNNDIDIEKLFEKGVSGKENHTGLGLWEVRKIVKKHKNLNLYTNKNDKYFTQQLEIYN